MKQEVKIFEGHQQAVHVVEWHPFQEEIFVSADNSGQINYWKQNYGKLHEIKGAHKQTIWSMAWHPTGTMLVSTGQDAKVKIWGVCKPFEDSKLPPVSH